MRNFNCLHCFLPILHPAILFILLRLLKSWLHTQLESLNDQPNYQEIRSITPLRYLKRDTVSLYINWLLSKSVAAIATRTGSRLAL